MKRLQVYSRLTGCYNQPNHCRASRHKVKTLSQAWYTSELHGVLDRKITNLRLAQAIQHTMRCFLKTNQPSRKTNLAKDESGSRDNGFPTRLRIRMLGGTPLKALLLRHTQEVSLLVPNAQLYFKTLCMENTVKFTRKAAICGNAN